MNIPQQYLPVMPYLILNDAASFLLFAKNVFNAAEQMLVPGDSNKIMHGEIRIGDAVIMFSDATDTYKPKPAAMFLYVESVDNVHQLALQNNATEIAAPTVQSYGYSSGFEDRFGNQWFIVQG